MDGDARPRSASELAAGEAAGQRIAETSRRLRASTAWRVAASLIEPHDRFPQRAAVRVALEARDEFRQLGVRGVPSLSTRAGLSFSRIAIALGRVGVASSIESTIAARLVAKSRLSFAVRSLFFRRARCAICVEAVSDADELFVGDVAVVDAARVLEHRRRQVDRVALALKRGDPLLDPRPAVEHRLRHAREFIAIENAVDLIEVALAGAADALARRPLPSAARRLHAGFDVGQRARRFAVQRGAVELLLLGADGARGKSLARAAAVASWLALRAAVQKTCGRMSFTRVRATSTRAASRSATALGTCRAIVAAPPRVVARRAWSS